MKTSESIKTIASALLKAQRKMGSATKGANNPYFKSKYADLGAVMEVVKDPLNEEGITILQPTYSRVMPETNQIAHFVETTLLHESGEFITSDALKLELNKTDMQALGSAITYARRYTLQSLLSIPSEDDDGNAASGKSDKHQLQQQISDSSSGQLKIEKTTENVPQGNTADTPKRTSFRKSGAMF